ncbi:MAG: peptide ABC transporter substrate-binding protein [Bauldia sp.]|nr:peptide ABC transporter substrate-binding protein [Bauldia sp.]
MKQTSNMKTVLSAALLLVFASLASGAAAQVLYERGNSADPVTLDPQKASTAAEANILRDLYEGLVTTAPDGSIIPGVAETWETSPDGLTWTFHLRDTTWSDGAPVTADDFVRAFRRLLDPATAAPDARLFAAVAGVRAAADQTGKAGPFGVVATDPRTLTITLTAPVASFLDYLARPAAMPIPAALETVPAFPTVTSPFNGAYRFDGFVPGDGMWLIRNTAFHDATNVAIETVVYRPYDTATAFRAFSEGTLLSNNDVGIFTLPQRREALGEALRIAPFAGSYFYAANTSGVLADQTLRRAVALAINRNRIAAEIWEGTMVPTRALLPTGLPGYPAPVEVDLGPNERDVRLAEARALVTAAGYGEGNSLSLRIAIAPTDLNRATAAAVAEDLGEIGITATIVERATADHYAGLAAPGCPEGTLSECDGAGSGRDFDLASVAWIGDAANPAAFFNFFAGANGTFAFYGDAEFEGMLAEAALATDPAERAMIFGAVDARLMADLPAIPMLGYASLNLVSTTLTGWIDNPLDVHLTRWMGIAAE